MIIRHNMTRPLGLSPTPLRRVRTVRRFSARLANSMHQTLTGLSATSPSSLASAASTILIDRDGKFSRAFHAMLEDSGVKPVHLVQEIQPLSNGVMMRTCATISSAIR